MNFLPELVPFREWPHWANKNKTLLMACVLTGAEVAVAGGVNLPGADLIPIQFRGMLIAALGGFALWFRIKAGQEKAGG